MLQRRAKFEAILNEVELLTAKEVGNLLRCSRSQVYKMRKTGLLPPPVHIFPGQQGARWLRQDVVDFILQARSFTVEATSPRPFVPIHIAR